MSDKVPMTPRGFERLKEELNQLKTVERPANVRDIEVAREHGDLSENAEYHAAKEKQGHLNGRIEYVEDRIARAQPIEANPSDLDRVRFGTTVMLSDTESGDEVSYTIVGEDEADASSGLLSVTSPVARALMGKEVDDEVTVRVPKGTRVFEVLEIRVDV
ncbi:MAG: transcription elongation factor GreA [bacterium]|nr:transcription elongation factor GreA [bacterium]MCP5042952.1 transcription elongation factor GreA [bacterium]